MTYDPVRTPTKPHTLYRAYAPTGLLLYVGVTCDFRVRLGVHAAESPWWIACVEITTEEYPDRASGLAAEKRTIAAEQPVFNVRHKGSGAPSTMTIRPHLAAVTA